MGVGSSMMPQIRLEIAAIRAAHEAIRRAVGGPVLAEPIGRKATAIRVLKLANAMADFEGVTLWAISYRFFAKGDFFRRLEGGGGMRVDTYERVMALFSQNWPQDLEWPRDIPRPNIKREAA